MVFSSDIFLLLFLPVTLGVYYGIRLFTKDNLAIPNIWLLAVSLVFYAWGEPVYVLLMMFSIFVNYLFGISLEGHAKTTRGKRIVALACVFDLGLLFVFKYLGWLLGLFDRGYSGVFASLALPIGISFYTFQALSYVVDVYRGKNPPQKSILNIGLYISFFPQLIAGPIVTYGTVAQQLQHREHTLDKFSQGVWRFARGLVKKILLANQIAGVAEWAFRHSGNDLTVVMAWVGAIAFMLQLYFDFSGYSDMAIGLGKMFGFEFRENFNYPFASVSVSEYWRRWHISLGEWFREYLFFPLSLGVGVKLRKAAGKKFSRKTAGIISSTFVMLIVWMATGLWHGANLTFLVGGFLQFAMLTIEQYQKPIKNKKLGRALGHFKTILFWIVGAVIFNAASLWHAGQYYADMLALHGNPLIDHATVYWLRQYAVVLIVGAIFAFPVVPVLDRAFGKSKAGEVIWNGFKTVLLMIFLLACLSYAISGSYSPFIYFNF